ncbi:hypothetical protein [Halocola ammonii]
MIRKVVYIAAIVFTISCVTPSSCAPSSDPLAGKWKFFKALEDNEGIQVYGPNVTDSRTIEFFPNGELHHFNHGSRVGLGLDEYKVDGDSITIASYDILPEGKQLRRKLVVSFATENDTLIIEDGIISMIYLKLD